MPDLVRRLIDLIGYEEHLRKASDWESRWENIQELINFAKETSNAPDEEVPASNHPPKELLALEDDGSFTEATQSSDHELRGRDG